MKDSIFSKKIELKYEKQIKVLILVAVLRHVMSYLFDLTEKISTYWGTTVAEVLIYTVIVIPAFVAYKKVGLYREKINFKEVKQYLYGIVLIIPLIISMMLVFGMKISDLAKSEDELTFYDGFDYIWLFLYFVLVVGVTEEFCYRIYIQGELQIILGKLSWLAPIISAALFAYMHIVQGTEIQANFTFLVGIVLGYARQYIKGCTFISIVIAHGLYDFLVVYFVW